MLWNRDRPTSRHRNQLRIQHRFPARSPYSVTRPLEQNHICKAALDKLARFLLLSDIDGNSDVRYVYYLYCVLYRWSKSWLFSQWAPFLTVLCKPITRNISSKWNPSTKICSALPTKKKWYAAKVIKPSKISAQEKHAYSASKVAHISVNKIHDLLYLDFAIKHWLMVPCQMFFIFQQT